MYTKINMPKGLNSGSCSKLASYLNKEENGFFFDKSDKKVDLEKVINDIDNNKKGIRKNEDKFYMISFSPSKYELEQLIGKSINDDNELTYKDKLKLFSNLRDFTHESMDIYAKSFNRKDVADRNDLIYFGRIETKREYHHYDKEVTSGIAKVGDKKAGLQYHIHVIVSRNAVDNKCMLSPNIRFRNRTFKQGNNVITRGFNYTDFTQKCSQKFTEKFNIPTRSMHSNVHSSYQNRIVFNVKTQTIGRVKNTTKRKVVGSIKSTLRHEIMNESFNAEKQIIYNTNKIQSVLNNIRAIATGSNPIIQSVDLAIKTIQTINQLIK